MAPTLNAGFAHLPGAFRSLAADMLLPPAPEGAHGRRPLLRGAALLAASAALARGGGCCWCGSWIYSWAPGSGC